MGEFISKIFFKISGSLRLIIELIEALKPFFCLFSLTLSIRMSLTELKRDYGKFKVTYGGV